VANSNSIELSVETIDDTNSVAKHSSQARNHRNAFVFDFERYLRGEIHICLKGSMSGTEIDSKDFYALIGYSPENRRRESVDLDARLFGIHFKFPAQLAGPCDYEGQPMLVDHAPLIKGENSGFIPDGKWNAVRLYGFDEFFTSRREALYTSTLTGRSEFFSRGADGKLVRGGMSSTLFFNQAPDQMVQGGSEVIKNFSDENGEANRNDEFAKEREHICSSIVLEFADYSVGVRICRDECIDLGIQISDVLFGPLNLAPYAV
jgi:hypothetical protein